MKANLSQFFAKVYGWTFLGLMISGVTAMWMQSVPDIESKTTTSPLIMIILLVIELLLVIFLVKRLKNLSPCSANSIYFIYSAFTGATISAIFIYFEAGVISIAFFITAVTFILMATIGTFTKADLAHYSGIFMMGLIGITISIIVNMFMQATRFDYTTSIIFVIIFMLLIGYSRQKLEAYYKSGGDNKKDISINSLIGALDLYLDLINMFISPILRIFKKD